MEIACLHAENLIHALTVVLGWFGTVQCETTITLENRVSVHIYVIYLHMYVQAAWPNKVSP